MKDVGISGYLHTKLEKLRERKMSNPTLNQIRNLNTQEKEQLRRYQQRCLRCLRCLRRIAKPKLKEQNVNSRPNNSINAT